MDETFQVISNVGTSPRPGIPPASSPPSSPLLDQNVSTSDYSISPMASPTVRGLRPTRLDPREAWLPLTESRNGNKYYTTLHTLCSGIGTQALVLPLAFAVLGWGWGITALTLVFVWQLYTLWLLVQLHESPETGTRCSRYLQLSGAAFGNRLGKWLAWFPIAYLSGGTCVNLIIVGGSTFKLFCQTLCSEICGEKVPVTSTEWYLIFTCAAVVLSQLPNLNSMVGVSLLGAVCSVGYFTLIWVTSVAAGRVPNAARVPKDGVGDIGSALNALGIIAFAFRGHNLVLEIQGTMPSSNKNPSRVPMWEGVRVAYALIAICIFPLSIGGYWVYGYKITSDGMLAALYKYHSDDVPRALLLITSLLVIVNALCSFQIYAMPPFDDMECLYTSRKSKPCPWWLRTLIRILFGFLSFGITLANQHKGKSAGFTEGLSLPVTLAYPCFMWLNIKKPERFSHTWWLNWGLGVLGMSLSILLTTSAIWVTFPQHKQQ